MRKNEKLPSGWISVPLRDLIAPKRNRVLPSDKPKSRFIGLEHVEAHTMRLLGTVPSAEMKSSAAQFNPGNVLYGRLRPYLNKVFRPDFDGLCSSEFIVFPDADCLRSHFLQYRLNAADFVNYASHLDDGDRPRVDFNDIGKFILDLPPEPEQNRIVSKIEELFSDLDAGVAALERSKEKLKKYRASVLKAAVEGKLTAEWRKQNPDVEPAEKLLERILAERRQKWVGRGKYKEPVKPNISSLPAIPNSWVWCMSDALFSFVTSGSRGWAKHYSDTGKIFLRIGNLDHENIRLDLGAIQYVKPPAGAEGTRTIVQNNDILISITADVGMVALVPGNLGEAYINQHIALARPISFVYPVYVALYLCASEGGWGQFKRMQRGATKVGLGLDNIKSVFIPLPPLLEQRKVVAEIEYRLSVVEKLEEVLAFNLQRATRLRQAILKRAFEGKLVPQDPKDEPAEVLLARIRAENAREEQTRPMTKKPKRLSFRKKVKAK